jgi:hypothetical protein
MGRPFGLETGKNDFETGTASCGEGLGSLENLHGFRLIYIAFLQYRRSHGKLFDKVDPAYGKGVREAIKKLQG